MRVCNGCKEEKPVDEFYWKNRAKSVRQGYCKACKTRYNKTWYQKNKEKHKADVAKNGKIRVQQFYDYVNRAKNVPCADCKGSFPVECMDFDHLSYDKLYNVSAMTGHSLAKIEAEIAKCEVVCANCHRIRTKQRRSSSEERASVS